MKLSTKIILPLILISALLILLTGCFSVPADEEPGYTPGTITGVIAAPCCSTSAEPVPDPCCIAPEYWCYYCENTWSLQDGVEVILTYGEEEKDTVFTNEDGEYTFTNVEPGKNYVITALCPDYDDERPLVKDVALEVVEGETYDAKITDCISTSLGLVVDFLVSYTVLEPEDINLEPVVADIPNLWSFPRFKTLAIEVCRVVKDCGNLSTDEDVQEALCEAAEEVGRIVIPDLELGCGPGYTPPPPGACDGNTAPSISSVLLDGTAVSIGETVHVVVGTPYVVTVNASDDGIADPLTYSATVNGIPVGTVASNVITVTPLVAGTFEVYVNVNDGCTTTTWGPVTVNTVTYNVYYDANTGTGTQTDTNDYFAGASVTVKDEGTMAKANHTFSHWDTQADDLGTNYDPADPLTMPASDVTLYAQWDEDEKYNVTYDANGGTGSQTDGSSPYYAGATVTVLDENDMELAGGYIFSHWDTQADDLGTNYDPADPLTMPASDVTLYAQWVCDPCSGWDATGVTVIKWYAGSSGNSDPRLDIDGTISGPACAGVTEIDIEIELYNNGGTLKESFTDTLFSATGIFTVDLDVPSAFYNSITDYKLWITVDGCTEMMILEGPVEEL